MFFYKERTWLTLSTSVNPDEQILEAFEKNSSFRNVQFISYRSVTL